MYVRIHLYKAQLGTVAAEHLTAAANKQQVRLTDSIKFDESSKHTVKSNYTGKAS